MAKDYLTPEIIHRNFGDDNKKEIISSGLQFTVRQQGFIKSRMPITCQAIIEHGLYNSSTDIVILEENRPKRSCVVENDSYFGIKSENRMGSSSSTLTPNFKVPKYKL